MNAAGGTATKPGLGAFGDYGGTSPNESSGTLEYVRIEYGGGTLAGGLDGVSLDLCGVGSETTIDHVMSRWAGDDCLEVLGGTANVKHLICQAALDDGIVWEQGWTGKAQFVLVQGRPNVSNNSNGFQGRSGGGTGPNGEAIPISAPTIYNATLCGQNVIPQPQDDQQQYGIRADSFTHFHVFNSIFMGWEALFDVRGDTIPADVDAGAITFRHSLAFGNLATNVAYSESLAVGGTGNRNFDDDKGFDETAWWVQAGNFNSQSNPSILKCFDQNAPRLASSGPIGAVPGAPGTPHAVAPPNDGFFDPSAKYLGALKDENDDWVKGAWVLWSDR